MTSTPIHVSTSQPPTVARHPAFPAAIAFLAGIGVHSLLPHHALLWLAAAACMLLLAVGCRRRGLLATLLLCTTWAIAGVAAGQIAAFSYPGDHISHFASDTSRLAQLELRLNDPPRVITNPFDQRQAIAPKQVAQATVVRVRATSGWTAATGDVLLQINDPHPTLAAGQTVRVTGMLQRPAPAMNPGQFDWAGYYRERRVLASFTVNRAECMAIVADDGPSPLTAARLKARSLLADGFTQDQSLDHAVLRALLLGDNDPQLRDVQEQFQQTGTAHHLAISGTHVALLAGMVWLVCRMIAIGPRNAAIISLVFTVAYGALALPSPPVVRSIVLASAMGIGVIGGRRGQALTLLSASVVAMLIYHPLDLFNAGFQLSFGTVLGLVLLTGPTLQSLETATGYNDPDRVVKRSFETPSASGRFKDWLNRRLLETLSAGIVAWLVSMPLIAFHFEQLNPWAIVAGIFLAVFVMAALAMGMLKLLLTALLPFAAGLWADLAAAPIRWMRGAVEWLASWPGADIPVPPSPLWLIALFYGLMLTTLWRNKPDALRLPLRAARLVAAAFIVVPALQAVVNPAVPAGTVRVTLLAVGAGQCAVVQPPGGRTIIVDAGSTSLADLVAKCLGPFLRHARCTGVDTLVLSHADFDHVSAAAEVVESYGVREVIAGDRFGAHARANPQTRRLMSQLADLERPPRQVLPGDRTPLSADTAIEVLWPPATPQPPATSTTRGVGAPAVGTAATGNPAASSPRLSANDGSLVFRLTHRGKSILFTGDIMDVAMRELLKNPEKLRADVLVAMHHGSAESASAEFIAAVDPKVVVASNDRSLSGKQRTFDRLCEGRRLLRTHDGGAITITIDAAGDLKVEPFVKPQR